MHPNIKTTAGIESNKMEFQSLKTHERTTAAADQCGTTVLLLTLLVVLTLIVTFIAIPKADADIYVYIDKNGVCHFTNTPTSENYKIYMRESTYKAATPRNIAFYDQDIAEAAKSQGLSFHLLKALIHVESDFNPRAVSKKGALGLTQIMPDNLALLNVRDPFDPKDNIMGGARYLKAMMDRFGGRLNLALAAYNAGPSAVERYRDIPPYTETRSYVEKVLKYFRYYKNS